MPHFIRPPWGPALLAALLALAPDPGRAQVLTPEKNFYVTDGVVEVVEVVGDSVYVGGHFTHVGPYTGPLAPVSLSTGQTVPGFPEADAAIFGLAPDGAGGWFVGGDFTMIGGVPRNHVAHVLPDLSVDPAWDPDLNHRVYGFAIHNGLVYMHGFFSSVGGQIRNRIASVDFTTGAVTAWDPNPSGGGVEDFFLDGDMLYVAGTFSSIAGQPRNMAAFDLTTGALTAFDPDINNQVIAVAAKDGVVYAGGRFTVAADSTRNRAAAFDAATSALLPWHPDVSGTVVEDIALGDSTLYLAGGFAVVGGELHNALAEVDLATGAPLNTVGGTVGLITQLLVDGNNLYVCGDFTNLDGLDRRFVGGFDRTTGSVLDTVSPLDVVNAMAVSGDTLYLGGEFGAVSGVIRNRFAAFHASTLALLPWAPDFDNIVWAIEASPGADSLYVAGRFLTVDGAGRDHVALFDRGTGALSGLNVGVVGDVYDISVADSTLYLGGTYHTVQGQSRADLASVHRVTGVLTPWNPVSGGLVYAITALNDTVYVGGAFFTIGDSSRTNVAAVDGTTGAVLGWGSSLALPNSSEVESFFPLDHPSYPGGALFMGGDFLNLGIGLRRGVAALNRTTGNSVFNWNPYLGPSFETEVRDFALADGLLYVAGEFRGVFAETEAKGVAALDVVTGEINNWIVTAEKATSIAVSDSMVFIGGNLSSVQGYLHTNLAAFRRDTEPPLAASSLVAAPGAADKRIDLAWAPSPSGDVKDYVIYRTATAAADTTNRQIGITAATSYADVTPTYGDWYYRVYSRDQAHNLGPASNEATASAPVVGPPDVVTSVLQNPALSRYANVTVVSDSLLLQPPTVTVTPSGAAGTVVPMQLLAGATSAYRGPYVFGATGLHTIDTDVTAADGQMYSNTRNFTVTMLRPDTGGTARSPGGLAMLDVPAGALQDVTYVVMEERDGGIRIGPALALDGGAMLEIVFDAARFPDAGALVVARMESGRARPLESDLVAGRNVVRARIDQLGEYRLVDARDFPAFGEVPLRFALHPNHPNPFGPATALVYDLPRDGPVRVAVFDVNGRRVVTLHDGFAPAGRHRIPWDGRNGHGARLASGVYFARITADGAHRSRKMVLLR